MKYLIGIGLLTLALPGFTAENNVQVTGALVAEPCTLDLATTDITLDFGNLVGKYFYRTPRTPGQPFIITLDDCDTSLGNSATVTFRGTESLTLPGFLVPDAGDIQGIAFGIETDEANPRPVALNTASPVFTLTNGNNSLALRGYVQAEPQAIAAQSITAGAFTATATFEIEYP